MKCIVSTACVLSVLVAASYAAPFLPAQFSASSNLQLGGSTATATATTTSGVTSTAGGGLTNVLSNIDLPGLLRGVNSFVKLVGVFCPPLSQVLDNVIQNVTSTAFRVFGRLILRGGGLGGGASGGSAGGGQRVNVVLPTYPPDDDEDYDDDEDSNTAGDDVDVRIATSSTTTTTTTTTTTEASSTAGSTTEASSSTSGSSPESDSVVNTSSTLYTSPSNEDNAISKRHVRVARATADQEGAESAPQPADDLSIVDEEDADRNKRFLPFGGTVSAHGSGGGSGNFLFDLIRLVAGSGATEETDEKVNAPGGVAEVDVAKTADGYTEGIPGPITRLFVIANRGLANLVQDLILRLASTSERIVNFKARLVTALI